MAAMKSLLYLEFCWFGWIFIGSAAVNSPKAENVHWFSLDFKTVLTWTSRGSTEDFTYTVLYSRDDADWSESIDCIQVSYMECDMTHNLSPLDRSYTADIQTEHITVDYNHDPEELTHTYSLPFNPYRESNISAAKFSVHSVDERTVSVNITDPLTSIHENMKQLSIRDVLRKDLKYKISYYKSGSTGKRDIISDSSDALVSQLDSGESYCFMVAAFIPTRAKSHQQGAWSKQLCIQGQKNVLPELSVGAWVGAVFIVLTVLIIIVAVLVLCCKCCQRRNKALNAPQTSGPV